MSKRHAVCLTRLSLHWVPVLQLSQGVKALKIIFLGGGGGKEEGERGGGSEVKLDVMVSRG